MTRQKTGPFALLVLALACVLASCHVRGSQRSEIPFLKLLERKSGLISFVAPDGNVHIIDQTGARNRALTDDAGPSAGTSVLYTAVTLSPDGRQVAFTRFTLASDMVTDASLYIAPARDGGSVRVFTSAWLVPFYLSWSPDSRRISLLSQVKGESDLELGVSLAGKDQRYVALDRGAPYYWDWLADSSTIAAHANAQRGGSAGERLSLISVDPATRRSDLPVQTDLFQAPNISPDGKSFVYVSGNRDNFDVHLRRLDGSAERIIASDAGAAYFALSGDGKHLAYLAALSVQPVPQGSLTIVSLEKSSVPAKLTEVPVLAFFWAPDSRKLAFIMPDSSGPVDPMFQSSDNQLNVRLMGCEAKTGRTWTIARFPATRGLLTILPFFDQYQRSATIWSPDSRYTVFTAISSRNEPAVYVVRADGNTRPRFLTAGDSAFWSRK
jgi:Tol biopolymer transport system component